jgi:hypothetical protein
MLQCGPSLRTFVHLAAFLLAETSVCGQTRLLQLWLLLTQHLFAVAAAYFLRCSGFRQSGHSNQLSGANPKLSFSCEEIKREWRGTKRSFAPPALKTTVHDSINLLTDSAFKSNARILATTASQIEPVQTRS